MKWIIVNFVATCDIYVATAELLSGVSFFPYLNARKITSTNNKFHGQGTQSSIGYILKKLIPLIIFTSLCNLY